MKIIITNYRFNVNKLLLGVWNLFLENNVLLCRIVLDGKESHSFIEILILNRYNS
jgi:hypothetical protein